MLVASYDIVTNRSVIHRTGITTGKWLVKFQLAGETEHNLPYTISDDMRVDGSLKDAHAAAIVTATEMFNVSEFKPMTIRRGGFQIWLLKPTKRR